MTRSFRPQLGTVAISALPWCSFAPACCVPSNCITACTTASPRLCWQGSLTNKQTNRQTNKQTDSQKVVVSLMTVANCFGFTATTTTTTTTHSQQLVAFSLLQGICDHGYVVYGRQSITHSSPFTPLQPCPHRLQSTGRHLNSVAY
jgi:hypothetical protein